MKSVQRLDLTRPLATALHCIAYPWPWPRYTCRNGMLHFPGVGKIQLRLHTWSQHQLQPQHPVQTSTAIAIQQAPASDKSQTDMVPQDAPSTATQAADIATQHAPGGDSSQAAGTSSPHGPANDNTNTANAAIHEAAPSADQAAGTAPQRATGDSANQAADAAATRDAAFACWGGALKSHIRGLIEQLTTQLAKVDDDVDECKRSLEDADAWWAAAAAEAKDAREWLLALRAFRYKAWGALHKLRDIPYEAPTEDVSDFRCDALDGYQMDHCFDHDKIAIVAATGLPIPPLPSPEDLVITEEDWVRHIRQRQYVQYGEAELRPVVQTRYVGKAWMPPNLKCWVESCCDLDIYSMLEAWYKNTPSSQCLEGALV